MTSAPLSALLMKVLPHKQTTRKVGITAVILRICTLWKTMLDDITWIIITLTVAIASVKAAVVVTLRERQSTEKEETLQREGTLSPV